MTATICCVPLWIELRCHTCIMKSLTAMVNKREMHIQMISNTKLKRIPPYRCPVDASPISLIQNYHTWIHLLLLIFFFLHNFLSKGNKNSNLINLTRWISHQTFLPYSLISLQHLDWKRFNVKVNVLQYLQKEIF